MSKNHRDNHNARLKRGPSAFAKKAERRAASTSRTKCTVCGTLVRNVKLEGGMCPPCLARLEGAARS